MSESEWLTDINVAALLCFVEDRVGRDPRRLRLFACACCRRVWHLLQLDAARRVVELAEAYADGHAEEADLHAANASADFVDFPARMSRPTEAGPQFSKLAHNVIEATRWLASPTFDKWVAVSLSDGVAGDPDKDFFFDPKRHNGGADVLPDNRQIAEQAKLLRDIFGNPFRPMAFDPAWRTRTVLDLAGQMYKSRDFSAMPILADALQDAGCDSEEVLGHCHGEGPHVRGCWVVDQILGKE